MVWQSIKYENKLPESLPLVLLSVPQWAWQCRPTVRSCPLCRWDTVELWPHLWSTWPLWFSLAVCLCSSLSLCAVLSLSLSVYLSLCLCFSASLCVLWMWSFCVCHLFEFDVGFFPPGYFILQNTLLIHFGKLQCQLAHKKHVNAITNQQPKINHRNV